MGEIPNDTGLDESQILESLIVNFENNRQSVKFSNDLKEKYFSDKQSEKLIYDIINKMSHTTDPQKFSKFKSNLLRIINNEYNKQFSNVGYYVGEDVRFWQQKILEIEKINNSLEKINADIKKYIKLIDATNYYDKNEGHSIEHIQKVMLFAGLLAQYKGLSPEETRILLIAAAFHDSGRNGRDNDVNHAEASAKKLEEYFRKNPNNPFGITKENLGIIQVAIAYHEHYEICRGRLDEQKLEQLCKKYKVKFIRGDIIRERKNEFLAFITDRKTPKESFDIEMSKERKNIRRRNKFETIGLISTLLKDSDALDRYRFYQRGLPKEEYMHTDISVGMMGYAKKVNDDVKELHKQYGDEKIPLDKLFEIYGLNEKERTNLQETTLNTQGGEIFLVAKNKVASFTNKPISLLFQSFYRFSQKIANMSKDKKKSEDKENQHDKKNSQR